MNLLVPVMNFLSYWQNSAWLTMPRFFQSRSSLSLSVRFLWMIRCRRDRHEKSNMYCNTEAQQWIQTCNQKSCQRTSICMFIVWYPCEFSRLHNFTPMVSELSLIRSHLLWGEFSSFLQSAANAIHNSPFFDPPCTHHCWMDKGASSLDVCTGRNYTSYSKSPLTWTLMNWQYCTWASWLTLSSGCLKRRSLM